MGIRLRILGLDLGSKRIGVALSDMLGFTAQPQETFPSQGPERDIERIKGLIELHGVTEIVVGMPYNMDGSEGPQAEKARAFMVLLGERTGLPVHEWDERLTTAAAERILLEADMSRAKRRKVVDKLAAVLILQGYLNGRGSPGRP